jgi:hypothetical protein
MRAVVAKVIRSELEFMGDLLSWMERPDRYDPLASSQFRPLDALATAGEKVYRKTRSLTGPDVLVESQHIVGIILFLEFHEASIVRPVCRPDKLVTRVAQLVDVDSMRKGQ